CVRRWGNPVPEPRDELDSWLNVQVKPLLPPPGTFEPVSGQARRRRIRRALLSAGGALAVAAVVAVVIPELAIPAHEAGRPPRGGPARQPPPASPRPLPPRATPPPPRPPALRAPPPRPGARPRLHRRSRLHCRRPPRRCRSPSWAPPPAG